MRPEAARGIGEGSLPDCAPALAMCNPPRVLLVDDDAALRASLKFAFELEGFDVEDHASAEGLLERADLGAPDCIVIDYRLPAMDGLSLLKRLRSMGVRAPVIVITSNPTRKLREAVKDAGAELVEKPLLCDALTARIRALSRPAASA